RLERDAWRAAQQRAGFERSTQAIVGNVWCQMVNMMVTDIAGEPMQEPRQIIVGAACDCGPAIIPGSLTLPICVTESVLHVEQPNTQRAGYEHHRKLHEQQRAPTEQGDTGSSSDQKHEI